jgi:hypothetical protein
MAAFQKFNSFVDVLMKGGVNLATDTLKVMLTNTAPVPTNTKYADIAASELGNGNGYTTGGVAVTGTTLTSNAGTDSLAADQTTFTSQTGQMGPFRYVVYYDDTAVNKPLVGFYDYGSSITLNGAAGETFVVKPGAALLTLN